MHICIVYKTGETEVLRIKRFSDLSTDKSDFYYYETDLDAWGQGTCVKKSDVLCIEIAPYVKADWPDDTVGICEPVPKPLEFAGETPRPTKYTIDPFNPHPGM